MLTNGAPSVAMRDMYMRTGKGFILVYSITSQSSWDEILALRDQIVRIKDDLNVPMVLVGNKADLEESRAVPRAHGFALAQRWNAPYYEASARTRCKWLLPRTDYDMPHVCSYASS